MRTLSTVGSSFVTVPNSGPTNPGLHGVWHNVACFTTPDRSVFAGDVSVVHDDQSGRRRCHCAADSVERTKRLYMRLNIHVIHNNVPHSNESIALSPTVAVATRNSVTLDVDLYAQDVNMPNEIRYMLQHWLAPLAFRRWQTNSTRLVASNKPLEPLEHIYYPNGQGSMHHLLVHESFGQGFVAFVLLQLDNSKN